MNSTLDYFQEIKKAKQAITDADAVVLGAGAGLSTSAGFSYTGKRFYDNFKDFEQKYDFHDMYSGGFYPYSTPEEKWAFWSRYVFLNRYQDPPKPVYNDLLDLVKDKEYFVLTTNVDHCFQKVGIDKERLFYTQGDYGLFQCSKPCHKKTYDNYEIIKKMRESEKDMKIDPSLVPKCPVCGREMSMNLRADDTFVEDQGWENARNRYEAFLKKYEGKKVVFLELGVGANTPVIIKYPFWRMTYYNKNATYITVNYGEAFVPDEIRSRSVCINADIAKFLQDVKK